MKAEFKGCYNDFVKKIRDLNGASYACISMTNQKCAIFCNNNGFAYFGLQSGYVQI